MKARKKAAVFGFIASTSMPSRNARRTPTGGADLVLIDDHRGLAARVAECPHADPYQVRRTGELEHREELCAGQHDGRHAEISGDHMHHAAEPRTDARRDTLGTSTGERACGDVKHAGPGRQREQKGSGQIEAEEGCAPAWLSSRDEAGDRAVGRPIARGETGGHTVAVRRVAVLAHLPFAFEAHNRHPQAHDGAQLRVRRRLTVRPVTFHGAGRSASCSAVSRDTASCSRAGSSKNSTGPLACTVNVVPRRHDLAGFPLRRVPARRDVGVRPHEDRVSHGPQAQRATADWPAPGGHTARRARLPFHRGRAAGRRQWSFRRGGRPDWRSARRGSWRSGCPCRRHERRGCVHGRSPNAEDHVSKLACSERPVCGVVINPLLSDPSRSLTSTTHAHRLLTCASAFAARSSSNTRDWTATR